MSYRHYSQACVAQESFPPVLTQLMELLKSRPFFKLLRMFTGLELAEVPLNEDDEGKEKNKENGVDTKFLSFNFPVHIPTQTQLQTML